MGFYTVWVRSVRYRGREPLTYSSDIPLQTGMIVAIPMQQQTVLGFIGKSVPKPTFQTKPISKVYDLPPLPSQLLQITAWLQNFYASSLGVATSQVLPSSLSNKAEQLPESVVDSVKAEKLPPLTTEQLAVVEKISKSDTYLLHGKTGSGKTRIYIELAARALDKGQSVIVLTPEISLTSQLAQSFRTRFGSRVVLLHSQLTPAQRQKVWLQLLRSQEPLLVIGPRSALFSPLSRVGLIVIDEAHETAYKQEQAPYYHARVVASELAKLHQATLIIGSATPSMSDYYLAEQRNKPILRMQSLARDSQQRQATAVTIVDLKDRSQFSRSQRLSQPLIEAVQQAMAHGQQSLIYLNRRGTARIVLCDQCGWQALCSHCDLPLVYHADSSRFRCHTCGFSQPLITNCPNCSNPSITFKSFGTKAITDELQRLFPNAKIQRFDTDNSKSERFEQHYESVKAGNVDILVGTQLLAKGLDLPKLAVLGIVLADSSLYLPDFSARERTYQLISQVLGRVGRGHVAGQAIIQTYQPDSPLLQAAIHDNWDNFYQTELAERRTFHFPPFYHLLKLSCRRASYKAAELAAIGLKTKLAADIPGIEIDGPAPSFHEKLQGKYQCQLVVRSRERQKLLTAIALLPPSGWTYDIDPINLL